MGHGRVCYTDGGVEDKQSHSRCGGGTATGPWTASSSSHSHGMLVDQEGAR
jgi:hypothetical protein